MKGKSLAVLWGVLMFCQNAVASGANSADKPKQDYWMGVYYDHSKVGSLHVTVREGRVNDKDGWIRDETMRLCYRSSGKSYTLETDREHRACNNYEPASDCMKLQGTDRDLSAVDETFSPGVGNAKITSGNTTEEKTLSLLAEDEAQLTSGCKYDLGGRTLSPGDRFNVNDLHFIAMILEPTGNCPLWSGTTAVSVERREKITIDGKSYNALVVTEEGGDVDITRWQLATGEIIKEERPSEHLVFLRETKEKATEVDEGPGPLLGQATSEPTAKPNPHLLSSSPANADYWMGVYSGSSKIGYFHVVTGPDKFEGKDVFRRDESLHLWTALTGKSTDTDFNHTSYAGNDFFPVFDEASVVDHTVSPQVGNYTVEIRYSPESADITTTFEGKATTDTTPVSEEHRDWLIDGCAYDFGVRRLRVGDSIDIVHWCWIANTQASINGGEVNSTLKTVRRQDLKLGEKTYNVFVISEERDADEKVTRWQLDNGEVIKQEMSGVTMVLESKEKATQPVKPVKPNAVGTK